MQIVATNVPNDDGADENTNGGSIRYNKYDSTVASISASASASAVVSSPSIPRRRRWRRNPNGSSKTVKALVAIACVLLSMHFFVRVEAIKMRGLSSGRIAFPLVARRRKVGIRQRQREHEHEHEHKHEHKHEHQHQRSPDPTADRAKPCPSAHEQLSDKPSVVTSFLDNLFQKGSYDRKEAVFVVAAAAIVGLNTGFLNGLTMSAALLEATNSNSYIVGTNSSPGAPLNPATEMIAGTAGSVTKMALAVTDYRSLKSSVFWYALGLVGSYIGGACLAGFINKGAQKHVIEPLYGPTFVIGGVFLSVAALLAGTGMPSRFVFFLATASLGVQNAIASLYSANLIRCTMTGVTTDLGLSIGQCLGGDFENLSKGMLLSGIVFCFWIGGSWQPRAFPDGGTTHC